MKYLDLINHFWEKDMEYSFSNPERALHLFLLDRCNRLYWKNPFNLSVEKLMAQMGFKSKKSLDIARNNLRAANLIEYKNGNGRGCTTEYTIINAPLSAGERQKKGNENAPLSDIVSGQFRDGSGAVSGLVQKNETVRKTKSKQDQTKPETEKLNASLASEEFDSSLTSHGRAEKKKDASASFEKFWDAYDKRIGKALCEKRWNSLTEADRLAVLTHVPLYVKSTPILQFRKKPINYLNEHCWLDEITPQQSQGLTHTTPLYGPSLEALRAMMGDASPFSKSSPNASRSILRSTSSSEEPNPDDLGM